MEFKVRAIDAAQQIQSFVIEALDIADARAQIGKQALNALSIDPVSTWSVGNRSANDFDLLLFSEELLALVAAGLSVVEALDALLERASKTGAQSVLRQLRSALAEGKRLSVAMQLQSRVFPTLFVGIVQAAEGTSDLPRALERYVSYETRLRNLRHKITSAAIYPVILLCVGAVVAAFLLGYVVPKFASVYQNSSRPLPWASQMLLSWGQFASEYALWLGLTALGLVVMAFVVGRRIAQEGNWARLVGWLPGVKDRIEILMLSRLYLTMGMLLEGGIPIVRAMQLSESVLVKARQNALVAARQAVEHGNSLSGALEQNALSTPISSRLLRVGEQTGQLGIMLSRTAAFYDNETSRWIEQFSKAFEPVLMAAIGAVIGLIVILLYMPIFDLAGSLH